MDFEKTYNPEITEDKWYSYWMQKRLFSSKPEEGRKAFTIVIPPPNVTGSLHMGHALNNTLQDIIIRFRRMQGYNALWVPGTDHGGIATQNVVEKLLLAEGKKRQDIGREKFVERMWRWRQESGDTILMQLRKLGCSLDWERTRFTMDDVASKAVGHAFIELYDKGFIYRGKRLVNWCTRCNTALSDIEVEHEEEVGKLWHITYPLKPKEPSKKEKDSIIVATTRPETMLGDTAVAVNPEDKRYKDLIGRKVLLPLLGREIPIVADEAVDPAFGTGAVKVTPSHDPVDFEIGVRHELARITVIDYQGKMTQEAGPYGGLDRFEARKRILEDLEQQGLLLETVEHPHAVGRCYRCDSTIEPLVSEQWFLKVEEMSRKAMKVVQEKKVTFVPDSWTNPYLLWLENLRDWCISRQIWWGHRIPVYYCIDENGKKNASCAPIVSLTAPKQCPGCKGSRIEQDPDVLDTWFSSALWPFSVFGWPDSPKEKNSLLSDLNYYYPTSVLVTGHEILYLWVARMIQMGLLLAGDIPFKEVFIHGIVRDKSGKKMSKSLGNVIDPLVVMKKYGTDALRFALTQAAAPGRDMQLSDDSFVGARNFANKLWNASRFIVMNVQNIEWQPDFIMAVFPLELADRWILSEYRRMVNDVTSAFVRYDMDAAARLIYEFFWSKYCDWYIELAKIRLNAQDEEQKRLVLSVLMEVLSGVLRLLHPIMPFITEEIWQNLITFMRHHAGKSESIMTASWPEADLDKIDSDALDEMALIQQLISAIRVVRSEMNVPPGKNISVICETDSEVEKSTVTRYRAYIQSLGKIDSLAIGKAAARPSHSASCIVAGLRVFIPLAGLIDLEKEKLRLNKDLCNAEKERLRCVEKLGNREFIAHAPEKEVAKMRERLSAAERSVERLNENLKSLE